MSALHCPNCSRDWCDCGTILPLRQKVNELIARNARLERQVEWYAGMLARRS